MLNVIKRSQRSIYNKNVWVSNTKKLKKNVETQVRERVNQSNSLSRLSQSLLGKISLTTLLPPLLDFQTLFPNTQLIFSIHLDSLVSFVNLCFIVTKWVNYTIYKYCMYLCSSTIELFNKTCLYIDVKNDSSFGILQKFTIIFAQCLRKHCVTFKKQFL